MKFKLKDNLTLGVATAAAQIEGGDRGSNWARFSEEGKINDGSSILRACGHWENWRRDIDLMADMGIKIYRFGIEWSRIEPECGKFSREVLLRYREEVKYMKERGISPLLTIHHFTHPVWFEDLGGFTAKESVDYFMRYVKCVVEAFGDLVSDYVTINEPNVYATNSLYFGIWPPEKTSIRALIAAYSNMTACHVRAYKYIHEKRRGMGYHDTRVSFANHLRVFAPQNPRKLSHKIAAKLSEWLFQGALTEAMMEGKCRFPVRRRRGVTRGKYFDFIGINYYSRSTVSGLSDGVGEGAYKNDLGWEIYPRGLVDIANALNEKYGAPVWVTENGTCDNEDAFRSRFIYDQLKLISEESLSIERYYHWSFTDNFEWREGESARFGIVKMNYGDGTVEVKGSGKFYADIIKHGGVTDEAYEKYVKPSRYHK